MLKKIYEESLTFFSNMPKDIRKNYGQFLTDVNTAIYMAGLFDFNVEKDKIRVLDPGAGTGILSAAFVVRAFESGIKKIELLCYENDKNILPRLIDNLVLLKEAYGTSFIYSIIDDNYIISQKENYNSSTDKLFDYIISNPPYLKISKDAAEAAAMPDICYGTPNLYFLFLGMSIFNSSHNAEIVYIIPRSWTSGAYFSRFRKKLLQNTSIEQIHLFIDRNNNFKSDDVLQETIIIKLKKTNKQSKNILITSSNNTSDFEKITKMNIDSNLIIGKNEFIYLIKDEVELKCFKMISKFNDTLLTNGFKMKTGLVVDFRETDILREEKEGNYPLFYSSSVKNPFVIFPSGHIYEYISPKKKGSIQKNTNYLFVKRFSSKEEKKRLQCSMYFSTKFSMYDFISTQNKVNFITSETGVMTDDELYGLY
ncbi:MAG: Eco57I restriction-modification methylase domain-containing protein, partial [Anaeroplasma sp.]|nr:Eco57I restriction-modification methylase domain-containing protein [Anaeroplasma sp.]